MTRATISTFTLPSSAAPRFRRLKVARATTNTFNNTVIVEVVAAVVAVVVMSLARGRKGGGGGGGPFAPLGQPG